jgi:hypothetical protein
MKRARLEKYIALVLFVLVLIIFSFAQKDSQKLENLYTLDQHSINLEKDKTAVQDFPYNNPFTGAVHK